MQKQTNNENWPRISIVTPSYNQGSFIEETIDSIVSQNYPKLDYIIIDGGSTDGSVDIIKKYETYLSYWVSEPDNGQYHALNKGFAKASGSIMAWLNADDRYFEWTLYTVAEIFSTLKNVDWITTCYPMIIDESGKVINCGYTDSFIKKSFLKGEFLPGFHWYSRGFIQQESTFWRRSLYEKSGAKLDDKLDVAGDFELWCRFFAHASLYGVKLPLGGFRSHGSQKTATRMDEYKNEALEALLSHGGTPRSRHESWLIHNVPNIYNLGKAMLFRENELQQKYVAYIKGQGWKIKNAFIKY